MTDYLTQEFTYSEVIKKDGMTKTIDGSAYFWAEQDAHNHDKSIDFSKFAKDWLVANADWPRGKIREGKFKSGQSTHAAGKELKSTGNAKNGKFSKA